MVDQLNTNKFQLIHPQLELLEQLVELNHNNNMISYNIVAYHQNLEMIVEDEYHHQIIPYVLFDNHVLYYLSYPPKLQMNDYLIQLLNYISVTIEFLLNKKKLNLKKECKINYH